jgi:hypothetical protein
MGDPSSQRSVYHVSPLRLWTVPIIFVAIAAFMLTLAGTNGGTPTTRTIALGMGIFFLLFGAVMYFIVRRTRLVLTAEGVRLHQLGYVLEAEWSNVVCLYDFSHAEGLVLQEPMASHGARTLAANRYAQSQPGVSFYSDEQIQLIAQHRFIPIEAFAYWMEKGLRDELTRRAQSLRNCSELGV